MSQRTSTQQPEITGQPWSSASGGSQTDPAAEAAAHNSPSYTPGQSTGPGAAAIVMPSGSGNLYPLEFAKYSRPSVVVIPATEGIRLVTAAPREGKPLAEVILDSGNLSETAEALRHAGVSAVLPGGRSGVELADALAASLGLPGNSPRTSQHRHRRLALYDTLASAGLPTIRTFSTNSMHNALRWASNIESQAYQIGIPEGAEDDFTPCTSRAEMATAWWNLQAKRNPLGHQRDLIVQEVLCGPRYRINSVSSSNLHRITEIWCEQRIMRDGYALPERADLLRTVDPTYQMLAAYTRWALTALGIEHGPAHTQIELTSRCPIIVDVESWPDSEILPYALERAIGSHHVRDTVVATLNPPAIEQAPCPPRTANYVTKVHIIADDFGHIDRFALEALLDLPSVVGASPVLCPGAPVRRTVGAKTSPGMVILAATDPDQIRKDYHAIRAIEANSLFAYARRRW